MAKVQNHLTDAKKIQAYNQKKEQKMRVRGKGGGGTWGGAGAANGSGWRRPQCVSVTAPL